MRRSRTAATSRHRRLPRTKGPCATGGIVCLVIAMMSLLASPPLARLIAACRLLHERVLLPKTHSVVHTHSLHAGAYRLLRQLSPARSPHRTGGFAFNGRSQ